MFGFVLGCTSLFASALLTRRGRAVAALPDALLSGWPLLTGIEVSGEPGALSHLPGAPLVENLHRFLVYTLLTSTGGWDTRRAITNSIAIVVLGPAVLSTLRRVARRARVTREPSGELAAT